MTILRIGSFNVENLFSRARVFSEGASALLHRIAELQEMLERPVYDKPAIVALFNEHQLHQYIDVRCDRVGGEGASPRFLFMDPSGRVQSINNAIRGPDDWSGSIEFRREQLSATSRDAVTRVVNIDLRADILCLCEVEDRRTLRMFNDQWLGGAYAYEVLLEGNDERGIDVALLSKHPIGAIRSETYMRDPLEQIDGKPGPMFHRDCLDVEILLPDSPPLHILCNHFKSKGGSDQAEQLTDRKRLAQSETVANILSARHRRGAEWAGRVVVAGDLNEAADRNGRNGAALGGRATSIDPLLKLDGLHNVLLERLPLDRRWTYEYKEQKQQIDYLLMSSPLNQYVRDCGAIYSGRPGAPGISGPLDAASDHAAIWVDLDL